MFDYEWDLNKHILDLVLALTTCQFPPTNTAVIAEYLCKLSDRSDRPKSVLNTASSAISLLFEIYDLDNLMCSPEIVSIYSLHDEWREKDNEEIREFYFSSDSVGTARTENVQVRINFEKMGM